MFRLRRRGVKRSALLYSVRSRESEAQMADKIRVGIVGATVTQGGSGWGANAHVPALKALPGYELKAVCTAHEDTAKASAAAFGAEHAFHRFSDMAAHPDVDLLVVCVRVPGHRELVMAGLHTGFPACRPAMTSSRWPGTRTQTTSRSTSGCAAMSLNRWNACSAPKAAAEALAVSSC